MAETTQLNRFRQKRLKAKPKEEKVGSYFYPKNTLYTRQEFELLDSIYSDGPSVLVDDNQETILVDNFWPQDKENLKVHASRNKLIEKLIWFVSGVMLTSVIWLIFFQVNVYKIKAENDTQIVFHRSATLLTDKTADKAVSSTLKNSEVSNLASVAQSVNVQHKPFKEKAGNLIRPLQRLFKKFEPAKKQVVAPAQVPLPVRYHTVVGGDSLWVVANKYYLDPSPANIDRIAKANNLRQTDSLQLGQRLIVP